MCLQGLHCAKDIQDMGDLLRLIVVLDHHGHHIAHDNRQDHDLKLVPCDHIEQDPPHSVLKQNAGRQV